MSLLDEILAGLSGQQPTNRLMSIRDQNLMDAGYQPGTMSIPNRLTAPQGGPPAAAAASPGPMPPSAPSAAPAPSPDGGGNFLSRLFGGGMSAGNPALNETASWLQKQGYDANTARALAGNKEAMQKILLSQVGSNKRNTAVIDGKLVDTDTGQVIGDYGDAKAPNLMNAGDGNLYNPATGEWIHAPQQENAGPFTGTSVEAQALNNLVKSGALTAEQANQLAAGKTVTDPATGAIIFMTPQGIFGQPAGGGTPQLIQPSSPPQAQPRPMQGPPMSAMPVTAGRAVQQPIPPTETVVGQDVTPPAPPAAPAGRPGVITLTGPKPGKMETEGERRAQSLYAVAAPELKRVEETFPALQDIYSRAASGVLPWGTDNYVTSPDYQRAKNSLTFLAQTYLYAMSGASAPDAEVEKIVRSVTPQPGESPESVADKMDRVKTMVEAIRMAGGPSAQPAPVETQPAPQQPAPNGVVDWKDWIAPGRKN
jgi:hypothetical protein